MLLWPGQGSKEFTIKRPGGGVSASGRPLTGGYEDIGAFFGVLSNASQKEIEQWKQNGHPISHVIVQPIPKFMAKAGDVAVLGERAFYIHGADNPGELNHFGVYHCEERIDYPWQSTETAP